VKSYRHFWGQHTPPNSNKYSAPEDFNNQL